MMSGKKKAFGSAALAISLVMVSFVALLRITSAPGLIVVAKPGPPGTYEIDIDGDASPFYMWCDIFQGFSAMKLNWTTSIPFYYYPPSYLNITIDARALGLDKVNESTYHLSLRGLNNFSFNMGDMVMFNIEAKVGEFVLEFSDPIQQDPPYYRALDITGTLKGDVQFHVYNPFSVPEFHYEGAKLVINIHMGM